MKNLTKNVVYIKGTNIPLTEDEIQTTNRREQESAANKMLSYQRLLQSAAHFDNTSDLDERSYFITVNPKYNCTDRIRKPVYFKVKQITQRYAFGGGSERPSLILDDDVSGSKYNAAFNDNHHLHGLLIMPKSQQNLNLHVGFDTETIKQQIGKLEEVANVDCQKYQYENSLAYVIGYGSKFVRKSGHEAFGGHQFHSAVYPYDMDMESRRLSDCEKYHLKLNYRHLLNLLYTNPAALLSEEYMHHFGEEIVRLCKQFPLNQAQPRYIIPDVPEIAA